jgi:hypothetical protein
MRDSRLAEDAAAVTRQGKYGPARVLAESCRVVRAEDVRVLLLESGVQLAPGAAGDVVLAVGDEADTVSCSVRWECRPNAVWSTGRLFLACPDCARGVGRLYIPPVNGVGLGCRECWGLGYRSKLENYRHGEASVCHIAFGRRLSSKRTVRDAIGEGGSALNGCARYGRLSGRAMRGDCRRIERREVAGSRVPMPMARSMRLSKVGRNRRTAFH